jgi:signal transduction histidine kinase
VVPGPDGVRIAVADRGPGIAPEDVERAFARFERLESHVQAGTGLGLYIARQLATALGATISLQSEVGKGSVFTLTLRAARALRVVG